MSVVSIRTKILAKLNEMQEIKAAYDWETSNPNGQYPMATLTMRDGDGEFRSIAHNLMRYGFRIRVYQERSKVGQGPETAEDIIVNVIKEVYEAFNYDTTLSGTCKYCRPVGWTASYIDREIDTRLLEINLDAFDIENAS